MQTTLRMTASHAVNSGFVYDDSNAADHRQHVASHSSSEIREAMIQLAAYSFYERRGMAGGRELEDWMQAEIEVYRRLSTADTNRPAN